MTKKPLPVRIDVELLARVDEARGDVSRTRFVERALESALKETKAADVASDVQRTDGGRPEPSASSRAPHPDPRTMVEAALRATFPPGVKTARQLMLERQAKLNKEKS